MKNTLYHYLHPRPSGHIKSRLVQSFRVLAGVIALAALAASMQAPVLAASRADSATVQAPRSAGRSITLSHVFNAAGGLTGFTANESASRVNSIGQLSADSTPSAPLDLSGFTNYQLASLNYPAGTTRALVMKQAQTKFTYEINSRIGVYKSLLASRKSQTLVVNVEQAVSVAEAGGNKPMALVFTMMLDSAGRVLFGNPRVVDPNPTLLRVKYTSVGVGSNLPASWAYASAGQLTYSVHNKQGAIVMAPITLNIGGQFDEPTGSGALNLDWGVQCFFDSGAHASCPVGAPDAAALMAATGASSVLFEYVRSVDAVYTEVTDPANPAQRYLAPTMGVAVTYRAITSTGCFDPAQYRNQGNYGFVLSQVTDRYIGVSMPEDSFMAQFPSASFTGAAERFTPALVNRSETTALSPTQSYDEQIAVAPSQLPSIASRIIDFAPFVSPPPSDAGEYAQWVAAKASASLVAHAGMPSLVSVAPMTSLAAASSPSFTQTVTQPFGSQAIGYDADTGYTYPPRVLNLSDVIGSAGSGSLSYGSGGITAGVYAAAMYATSASFQIKVMCNPSSRTLEVSTETLDSGGQPYSQIDNAGNAVASTQPATFILGSAGSSVSTMIASPFGAPVSMNWTYDGNTGLTLTQGIQCFAGTNGGRPLFNLCPSDFTTAFGLVNGVVESLDSRLRSFCSTGESFVLRPNCAAAYPYHYGPTATLVKSYSNGYGFINSNFIAPWMSLPLSLYIAGGWNYGVQYISNASLSGSGATDLQTTVTRNCGAGAGINLDLVTGAMSTTSCTLAYSASYISSAAPENVGNSE